MSRLTKSMLALMIINGVASLLFLTGLVNVSGFPGLYVVIPLTATFYGLFLIGRVFQQDMAEFDAEHHTPASPTSGENRTEPDGTLHGHKHQEPVHV